MILPSKFHSVLLHVTQTNTEQRESVKSVSFCVAMRENAAKRSEKKSSFEIGEKEKFSFSRTQAMTSALWVEEEKKNHHILKMRKNIFSFSKLCEFFRK